MSQTNEIVPENTDSTDQSGSLKTLLVAVFTGLVFWTSLFALLFFCLTS